MRSRVAGNRIVPVVVGLFWLLAAGIAPLGPCSAAFAAGEEPASIAEADGEKRAEQLPSPDCGQIIELLQQERNLIAREMGQLKRELAVLRQDISKPGMQEIFAGIGYILGLTGIALYVQTRKRNPG